MPSYAEAGVNLEAAAQWVGKLKKTAPHIGGFGAVYPLGEDDLVSSTDGVGTKIKLAIALNRHDTIGIDLVAMNANDILTTGAKPLFFLDYLAVSRLDPEKLEKVIAGISKGCEEAGCSLIGGETAQMGDLYREGDYDLAGFIVGIVKRKERIDGSKIEKGHWIVGLPSSGIHSNGFSLVRKIWPEAELQKERALGEILLTPTKIYVKRVFELLARFQIHGMAHITGGGFGKNIPRMLPKGLAARIHEGSWEIPEIFRLLQTKGSISNEEMRRVFNRGIGFAMALPQNEAKRLCEEEKECKLIGEVVVGAKGEGVVWD